MACPTQTASSPSSPKRRQLGFMAATDVSSPRTSVKSEVKENGALQDIWAELTEGDMRGMTEDMECDLMPASQNHHFESLSLPPSAPTSSDSRTSLGEGTDFASGSLSAKTTSESASGSSTYTSPSMIPHSESPISASTDTLPRLQPSTTNVHSSESIAQMLEYMRACNSSQERQPLPIGSQDRRAEDREGGRKRERSDSRSARNRKQKSPIQKLARSASQGGEGKRRSEAILQRIRSRQNSSVAKAPNQSELQIDTMGAVLATGPTGASRQQQEQQQQQQQHYSSSNELWAPPSSSPPSARSVSYTWKMENSGSDSPASATHTGQTSMGEHLSLIDFLKRPEGAIWMDHFRKQQQQQPSPPLADSAPPALSMGTPHSQPMSTPKAAMPYCPTLPRQLDVASVLGMQQSPNQALVQAFQTAFVLGLQQLGIGGGHVQQGGDNDNNQGGTHPLQTPYIFPWAQQASIGQTMPVPHGMPGLSASNADDGSSAILQNLLRDINQQRPNEEEFSLDDFLAFVANTMEHSEEDEGNEKHTEGKEQSMEMGKTAGQTRKTRATTRGREGREESEPEKKSRRRTVSISSQLNGTHLPDVIEDLAEERGNEGRGGGGQVRQEEKLAEKRELVEEEEEEGDRESSEEGKAASSSRQPKGSMEKEAKKLAERRRRRRESHNAVERRRRDHINERIAELASLLPESMLLDAIAASTAGGTTPHIDLSLFSRREAAADAQGLEEQITLSPRQRNHTDLERKAEALAPVSSSSETLALAQSKPNKGIILTKSVDYIKHLHEFCSVLRNKNKELQEEMNHLKDAVMVAGYDLAKPAEDSAMTTATPPPNLATWWSQYRENEGVDVEHRDAATPTT